MLLPTHVKIAKLLATTLYIPNEKAFIKGIRAPDLGFAPFFTFHTKENTLNTVRWMLEDMKSKHMTSDSHSYCLGVILHYVMDYFCKYHENNQIFKKVICHVWYEIKLEFKWQCQVKYSIDKLLLEVHDLVQYMSIRVFDPILFLEEQLKEYYSQQPSTGKDLEFAFVTSYIIALSLIFQREERTLKHCY